ncbi:putative metallophosphoesterase [Symmachiella macrocystis]|uniref:Putative metallophosphoesterase n=1 Tax=Symmachiella macrocystis TaxID=2527985 RepID=A0A5C6B7V5_9PLAN|nr:metallophosphoesterase [Symmachiella macrocystis]TWU06594.1 putative metallophosphoesterase [Symmachiella macrocystis]
MNWLNLLLMAVLSLGNLAIVVAVLNRISTARVHLSTLSIIRRSHALFIIGFTLALIYQGGFGRPRLLFDGSWLDIAPIYLVYLAACGISAIFASVIVVRRWFYRPPAALLSSHSEIIDVAAMLGKQPLAAGRYHSLAKLPGNEIFKVEIGTKDLHLPGLPQAWDGLSILHVSDLHFIGTITREYFEEVLRRGQELGSDMVVFTGDLLDEQHLTDWLPETLGQLSAPLGCYFILGNHDWDLDPDATRKCFRELGWIDVADRFTTIEHAEKKMLIAGSEYPWMGNNPDITAAKEVDFRLLLSHTPDNYPWARRANFDLMLSGHNHGGQICVPGIGPIYTPSLYGTRYSAGTFYRQPTLLYVTRGISGKEPLRYNCLPELTQLVLRPTTVPSSQADQKRKLISAKT